jgi:hypothetical protein
MANVTLESLDQKVIDLIETLHAHITRFEKHDEFEHRFQDEVYERLIMLDRLEQVEAARKWHIRTMWGAWVAAFIGWLFTLLHGWGAK